MLTNNKGLKLVLKRNTPCQRILTQNEKLPIALQQNYWALRKMKRSFEYPDMDSVKYLFTFKYKKGGQQGLGMGETGRCWSRVKISNAQERVLEINLYLKKKILCVCILLLCNKTQ